MASNDNSPCNKASCRIPLPLGTAKKGFRGIVESLDAAACTGASLASSEIEHRLMEMGFVEGSVVEILHEGLFCRDPIAVKVNETTIALRRREAKAVLVLPFCDDPLGCSLS
ncbi:MAG: FeoA family protein [Alphaproteobacteria bacterium]|nr:FeoA family protein [Alphaproteobacteria bacterium]